MNENWNSELRDPTKEKKRDYMNKCPLHLARFHVSLVLVSVSECLSTISTPSYFRNGNADNSSEKFAPNVHGAMIKHNERGTRMLCNWLTMRAIDVQKLTSLISNWNWQWNMTSVVILKLFWVFYWYILARLLWRPGLTKAYSFPFIYLFMRLFILLTKNGCGMSRLGL